jgi:hypothetical protein
VKNLVIPNAVKAMLAVFVMEQWNNTEEQREAMKKGLGIEKPALLKRSPKPDIGIIICII